MKKALFSLQTAEKLGQSFEMTTLMPQLLERRGIIFRQQGQLVLANRRWEAALEMYTKAKNMRGIVQCLFYMGESAYFNGDIPLATQHIEKALTLLSRAERYDADVRLQARLLIYLGHIHRKVKEDAEALAHYREALDLGAEVGDMAIVGKSLEGIGYIYGLLQRYDVAVSYLLQAVELFEKIDDKRSLIVAQSRLAQVYDYKGSSSEARVFCERALQMAMQHAPDAVKQTEDLLKLLKQKWRRLLPTLPSLPNFNLPNL